MSQTLVYCGPAGAGVGFQLSGIDVVACDTSVELIARLKEFVRTQAYSVIFVDEGLAAEVLPEIEALNQKPEPTIMVVPNPTNPQHLASRKLNQLMIKAVGSDIFSS